MPKTKSPKKNTAATAAAKKLVKKSAARARQAQADREATNRTAEIAAASALSAEAPTAAEPLSAPAASTSAEPKSKPTASVKKPRKRTAPAAKAAAVATAPKRKASSSAKTVSEAAGAKQKASEKNKPVAAKIKPTVVAKRRPVGVAKPSVRRAARGPSKADIKRAAATEVQKPSGEVKDSIPAAVLPSGQTYVDRDARLPDAKNPNGDVDNRRRMTQVVEQEAAIQASHHVQEDTSETGLEHMNIEQLTNHIPTTRNGFDGAVSVSGGQAHAQTHTRTGYIVVTPDAGVSSNIEAVQQNAANELGVDPRTAIRDGRGRIWFKTNLEPHDASWRVTNDTAFDPTAQRTERRGLEQAEINMQADAGLRPHTAKTISDVPLPPSAVSERDDGLTLNEMVGVKPSNRGNIRSDPRLTKPVDYVLRPKQTADEAALARIRFEDVDVPQVTNREAVAILPRNQDRLPTKQTPQVGAVQPATDLLNASTRRGYSVLVGQPKPTLDSQVQETALQQANHEHFNALRNVPAGTPAAQAVTGEVGNSPAVVIMPSQKPNSQRHPGSFQAIDQNHTDAASSSVLAAHNDLQERTAEIETELRDRNNPQPMVVHVGETRQIHADTTQAFNPNAIQTATHKVYDNQGVPAATGLPVPDDLIRAEQEGMAEHATRGVAQAAAIEARNHAIRHASFEVNQGRPQPYVSPAALDEKNNRPVVGAAAQSDSALELRQKHEAYRLATQQDMMARWVAAAREYAETLGINLPLGLLQAKAHEIMERKKQDPLRVDPIAMMKEAIDGAARINAPGPAATTLEDVSTIQQNLAPTAEAATATRNNPTLAETMDVGEDGEAQDIDMDPPYLDLRPTEYRVNPYANALSDGEAVMQFTLQDELAAAGYDAEEAIRQVQFRNLDERLSRRDVPVNGAAPDVIVQNGPRLDPTLNNLVASAPGGGGQDPDPAAGSNVNTERPNSDSLANANLAFMLGGAGGGGGDDPPPGSSHTLAQDGEGMNFDLNLAVGERPAPQEALAAAGGQDTVQAMVHAVPGDAANPSDPAAMMDPSDASTNQHAAAYAEAMQAHREVNGDPSMVGGGTELQRSMAAPPISPETAKEAAKMTKSMLNHLLPDSILEHADGAQALDEIIELPDEERSEAIRLVAGAARPNQAQQTLEQRRRKAMLAFEHAFNEGRHSPDALSEALLNRLQDDTHLIEFKQLIETLIQAGEANSRAIVDAMHQLFREGTIFPGRGLAAAAADGSEANNPTFVEVAEPERRPNNGWANTNPELDNERQPRRGGPPDDNDPTPTANEDNENNNPPPRRDGDGDGGGGGGGGGGPPDGGDSSPISIGIDPEPHSPADKALSAITSLLQDILLALKPPVPDEHHYALTGPRNMFPNAQSIAEAVMRRNTVSFAVNNSTMHSGFDNLNTNYNIPSSQFDPHMIEWLKRTAGYKSGYNPQRAIFKPLR